MSTDLSKQSHGRLTGLIVCFIAVFALVLAIVGLKAFAENATTNSQQQASDAQTTQQAGDSQKSELSNQNSTDENLSADSDSQLQIAIGGDVKVPNANVCSLTVDGTTTGYETIADAWAQAVANPTKECTLKLLANTTASATLDSGTAGLNLTLDLNGYTLDGSSIASSETSGSCIYLHSNTSGYVATSLVITDTSTDKAGVIKGGAGFKKTITSESGAETACYHYASGIYVQDAQLTIQAGSIESCALTCNYATPGTVPDTYNVYMYGAGVYCASTLGQTYTSHFTMTGGSINDNNITFTSNDTSSSQLNTYIYGAGLFAHESIVSIDGATISGNYIKSSVAAHASSSTKPYEAIDAEGAGAYIFHCNSYSSTAADAQTIKNTTISGNSFKDVETSNYQLWDRDIVTIAGAGIGINGTRLDFNTVTMQNNTGALFGGALYSDSINESESSYYNFSPATINLTNIEFSHNSAVAGGAIYLGDYSAKYSYNVTCNFISGSIHDNSVSLTDRELYNEYKVAAVGGGICCYSYNIRVILNITGGTIYNNKAEATATVEYDTEALGGGVYLRSVDMTMTAGSIYSNTVIATCKDNSLGGTATASGAGLYAEDTKMNISGASVYSNTANSTSIGSKPQEEDGGISYCTGGGITITRQYYNDNCEATISSSEIYNNQLNAQSSGNNALVYGAGVCNFYASSLTVNEGTNIHDNVAEATSTATDYHAYAYGGGIENCGSPKFDATPSYLYVDGVTIKDNVLKATNNSSTDSYAASCIGGGIDNDALTEGYAYLTLTNSTIDSNKLNATGSSIAYTVGGGVNSTETTVISGCTIQNGTANYGGGICYKDNHNTPMYLSDTKVINNQSLGITYNYVYYPGGGGIYAYNSNISEDTTNYPLIELGGDVQITDNTNVNGTTVTASNLLLEDMNGKDKLVSFSELNPFATTSKIGINVLFFGDAESEIEFPYVFSESAGHSITANFTYEDDSYNLEFTSNNELELSENWFGTGTYFIASSINLNSGLDVAGGSKDSQANIQLYNCNNTGAQKFKFTYSGDGYYYIQNTQSGKYLDVRGGETNNGTNIWQYNFNGTNSQKFKVVKYANKEYNQSSTYTFKSALDEDMVIDVSGANTSNGSNIQLYQGNYTAAQKFYVFNYSPEVATTSANIDTTQAYYIHLASKYSQVVDVAGASKESGANVQLYHYTKGDTNLLYKFEPVTVGDNTYYRIVNQKSGNVLCTDNGLVAPKTNVCTWAKEDGNDQLWSIDANEDGTLTFINLANGMALDCEGGQTKDRTNIWSYLVNGSDAQKFTLQPQYEDFNVNFTKAYGVNSFKDLDGNVLGSTVAVKEGDTLSFTVDYKTGWSEPTVTANDETLDPTATGIYTVGPFTDDVDVNATTTQLGGYLTFTAIDAGSTITPKYDTSVEGAKLYYRTDTEATEWTEYDTASTGAITLTNVDDYVQFYGTNIKTNSSNHFTMSGSISASGTVQSLLYEEETNGFSDTVGESQFAYMFDSCNSLVDAPAVSAINLGNGCYNGMFQSCSNLVTAPSLPATTLAESCYQAMFNYCTSLTEAPDLPADVIKTTSYQDMFYNCSKLTSAPVISASEVQERGCYEMFSRCSSLTTAPALPATKLAANCYERMFYGCDKLLETPELPATKLYSSCYARMFYGCHALTVATDLPAINAADSCYEGMFCDCTSLVSAPTLALRTLADSCCARMFEHCTSLVNAPKLHATATAPYCYYDMFYYCTSLKDAPELPSKYITKGCYQYMFERSAIETAPELPATYLADYCYEGMFEDCYNLTKPCELPATHLELGCYESMFANSSLTSVPELPATELKERCYSGMFYECGSLRYSADLSHVTSVAPYCCESMFEDCVNLYSSSVPSATKLSSDCYAGMYEGCSTLVDMPVLPATELASGCYANMFNGCKNLSYWYSRDEANYDSPEINATYFPAYCCYYMFSGCSSLEFTLTINKMLYAGNSCFACMYANCTSLNGRSMNINFASSEDTVYDSYCCQSMFNGAFDTDTYWYSTKASAVEIKGKSAGDRAFSKMYENSNVYYLKNINISGECGGSCFEAMFANCPSLVNESSASLTCGSVGYQACACMFASCTSLVEAPSLPTSISTFGSYCYYRMFYNCTSLIIPPGEITTQDSPTYGYCCFMGMFDNCTSLKSCPIIKDTESSKVNSEAFSWMFVGCTSLKVAETTDPETEGYTKFFTCTKASECYNMFRYCAQGPDSPSDGKSYSFYSSK